MVEFAAVIVASLSAGISLAAFVRSGKAQRLANDLAQRQLGALEKEERDAKRAQVKVALSSDRDHFYVENTGRGIARQVTFDLNPREQGEVPLIPSDFEERFPVPILRPGQSVRTIAALDMGSPLTYDVVVRWVDEDGTTREEGAFLAI